MKIGAKNKNSKGQMWLNVASSFYVLKDFVNLDNHIFIRFLGAYKIARKLIPKKYKEWLYSYHEAKQKAVQRVYDYLSSSDYNNKMNDVSNQLMELGKDLKAEIASHRRTWEKRYHIYSSVYSDITGINYSLKDLVQNRLEEKPKLMLPEKLKYLEIDELK